jgi:fumarate reductase flavoprotein subunit
MAETMIGKVGIFRTDEELAEAVTELEQLLVDCDKAVLTSKVPGMNPELSFALRLKGMLRLALVTAMGALARTESRGAHFRTDFPLRDDAEWLNRTLVRWPEGADKPEFSYEPVGLIDLAPGHRGYGRSERIEMDQTVEEYNEEVIDLQVEHGRLETEESTGSKIRWGEWGDQQ